MQGTSIPESTWLSRLSRFKGKTEDFVHDGEYCPLPWTIYYSCWSKTEVDERIDSVDKVINSASLKTQRRWEHIREQLKAFNYNSSSTLFQNTFQSSIPSNT